MNGQLARQPTINEIATLMVPVNGRHLVLPNVTVAEILPWREPETLEDVPTWLLGTLAWRNTEVPLVSFEALNDEPFAAPAAGRRIAILNNVTGDPNLPFCGVVTAGLPRLLRVLADEIAVDTDSVPGPAERARVLVSGEKGAIPDVAYIEQQVLAQLNSGAHNTL